MNPKVRPNFPSVPPWTHLWVPSSASLPHWAPHCLARAPRWPVHTRPFPPRSSCESPRSAAARLPAAQAPQSCPRVHTRGGLCSPSAERAAASDKTASPIARPASLRARPLQGSSAGGIGQGSTLPLRAGWSPSLERSRAYLRFAWSRVVYLPKVSRERAPPNKRPCLWASDAQSLLRHWLSPLSGIDRLFRSVWLAWSNSRRPHFEKTHCYLWSLKVASGWLEKIIFTF